MRPAKNAGLLDIAQQDLAGEPAGGAVGAAVVRRQVNHHAPRHAGDGRTVNVRGSRRAAQSRVAHAEAQSVCRPSSASQSRCRSKLLVGGPLGPRRSARRSAEWRAREPCPTTPQEPSPAVQGVGQRDARGPRQHPTRPPSRGPRSSAPRKAPAPPDHRTTTLEGPITLRGPPAPPGRAWGTIRIMRPVFARGPHHFGRKHVEFAVGAFAKSLHPETQACGRPTRSSTPAPRWPPPSKNSRPAGVLKAPQSAKHIAPPAGPESASPGRQNPPMAAAPSPWPYWAMGSIKPAGGWRVGAVHHVCRWPDQTRRSLP